VKVRPYPEAGPALEGSPGVRRVSPWPGFALPRLFGEGCTGAPARSLALLGLLVACGSPGPARVELVDPIDTWSRQVMLAWPSGGGCEAPQAYEADLTGVVGELPRDHRRMRQLRYLALQCDLLELQTVMIESVVREWPSFAGYRAHCHAGGSAHDLRCLVVIAAEGACRREPADDPRCAALSSLLTHHDGQRSVTTKASVPAPSSSTSTSARSPTLAQAASNSGR